MRKLLLFFFLIPVFTYSQDQSFYFPTCPQPKQKKFIIQFAVTELANMSSLYQPEEASIFGSSLKKIPYIKDH